MEPMPNPRSSPGGGPVRVPSRLEEIARDVHAAPVQTFGFVGVFVRIEHKLVACRVL